MTVTVEPGTVVLYSDVGCPWATLALHRLYAARAAAGLDDALRVEHRLFSLEDVNAAPLSKAVVDAELAVIDSLAPDFGWQQWQRDPAEWPNTMLLANEAVHAAKAQGNVAAEELDMALRRGLFSQSRPVSLLPEILDIARGCPSVDVDQLREALDDGRARGAMMRDYRGRSKDVKGSPHFFLADGTDVPNPGIELHWEDGPGSGAVVVDSDDKEAMDRLVRRAAGR